MASEFIEKPVDRVKRTPMLVNMIIALSVTLGFCVALAFAFCAPLSLFGNFSVAGAIFVASITLWWALLTELTALRGESYKLSPTDVRIFEEVLSATLKQVWGIFFLQVFGVIASIALFITREEEYARGVALLWALAALMSVVALGLLPGLRARIQEWKNGIAAVERQRRESEELVARLAKSAGEIKSSPFATYPEYLPDQ